MADCGKPECPFHGQTPPPKQTGPVAPAQQEKKYTFYFDIFFDGTGNNAFSTDQTKLAMEELKAVLTPEEFSAYKNS